MQIKPSFICWDEILPKNVFIFSCLLCACLSTCLCGGPINHCFVLFCLVCFSLELCVEEGVKSGFNEQKKIGSDIDKKPAVFFFVTFIFYLFVCPTKSFKSKSDWLYMTRLFFFFRFCFAAVGSATQGQRYTHWRSFADQPAALRPNVNNGTLMQSFWV